MTRHLTIALRPAHRRTAAVQGAMLALCLMAAPPALAQGTTGAGTVTAAAKAAPRALNNADVKRYQAIFAAQADGELAKADEEIAALEDRVLLGYVLEQRYMHPTAYRASYLELTRWLSAYADHPTAARVHTLAQKRRGQAAAPRLPVSRRWRSEFEAPLPPVLATDYANATNSAEVRRIEGRIRALAREGAATQALNYLNEPANFNALTAAQTDRARGLIAAAYYYEGELRKAKDIASQAAKRSPGTAVLSHWVLGLVAFRAGEHASALKHFAAQADIPWQEHELRAAGAFWAARCALRQGDAAATQRYLELAATLPLTFYGQLALGQLGLDPAIDWTVAAPAPADYAALSAASPRIARAVALAQIGRTADAETELKWAHGEIDPAQDLALLRLSHSLNLPNAQLSIGLVAGAAGRPDLASARGALFPVPDYAPTGGFKVDPALIYALIRQESKFSPTAESRVGAKGLMQLMPRTASYVADGSAIENHAASRLYDPSYNMQLGQSYVQQLLEKYNDGEGNLFEMALSYNWGPGNFQRWHATAGISDPLLMIESVPNPEARHFVETVLTNLWVYHDRLGEPAPSRDAVAAGGAPIYEGGSVRR